VNFYGAYYLRVDNRFVCAIVKRMIYAVTVNIRTSATVSQRNRNYRLPCNREQSTRVHYEYHKHRFGGHKRGHT